ncbi:hypothetical protein GLU64_01465 [Nanohaloarchaea archaeon]|nr:hypothetical protein [Candidatus Nanohaloarchaea archaeon]
MEEFLGYAEDFAKVIEIKEGSTMYELNRKYDISINEFNGRKYPSYWYGRGKDFIPNRAIGRLEKKYKLFKDLYSKPLEWEDKVRREWKREGEKYYSDLFIIENSISGVIQKFELFEKRLETYYASLEANIFHYSGTNNLKKTAQHLKKDIRRMKKDVKSMENS